jgi:hypothetical protein
MSSKVALLAAISATAWMARCSFNQNAELQGIKQAAVDYAEGWYEGDADRMEHALHPDLAKRALMPNPRSGEGKIDHMSALTLVQATRTGRGREIPLGTRRTHVTVLDVYGNAASVKLEMHDWVDYMHMSRIGGRWVVVNVLWELTPEAKKRHGVPEDL